MDKDFLSNLSVLLIKIFAKKENIYKTKYKLSGIKKNDISTLDVTIFKKLPSITLSELAKAPYKTRCLKEKPGLNKLIFSKGSNTYFLLHKPLEEIKKAEISLEGIRPMVLMQDVYEGIEHCLFFYEHHILPLIGEVLNPAIVYATAQQYNIDSLVIDHISITTFKETLLKKKLPLTSVTVIDTKIVLKDLQWPKGIKVSGILSLPEFGPVAFVCPKSMKKTSLIFHPYTDVSIEKGIPTLLTSTRLHACPMIRYRSPFVMKEITQPCSCKNPSFTVVDKIHS